MVLQQENFDYQSLSLSMAQRVRNVRPHGDWRDHQWSADIVETRWSCAADAVECENGYLEDDPL
jgi:hypothetical protein